MKNKPVVFDIDGAIVLADLKFEYGKVRVEKLNEDYKKVLSHQVHISESMMFDDERVDDKNCDLAFIEEKFLHYIPVNFDIPVPATGEKWRHFKGKIVEIIGISEDTEWHTKSVVYSHEGTLWNRPLEMFMSEVDREKYPNATQKYRFERVEE